MHNCTTEEDKDTWLGKEGRYLDLAMEALLSACPSMGGGCGEDNLDNDALN